MKSAFSASCLLLALASCSPKLIPNIDIALSDNEDHRALVQIIESYKHAFENKDVEGLMALASSRFYEDAGTPGTDDDYNYEGLRQHFTEHFKHIKAAQLNLRLKKVEVTGDKAFADYWFTSRYLMELPSGEKWQTTDEINRLDFVRENGSWKVIAGF